MRINHVMSADMHSQIFTDILGYFRRFAPLGTEMVISIAPEPNCDIYHYHRPHLEQSLKPHAVVTVHHDLNDNDRWYVLEKFLERYREAERIVCLNSLQAAILAEHGLTQTVVIPHGYNPDIFQVKPERHFDPNRKLVLGMVSKRYGRRCKGEADLLELLKRMDNTRFSFLFVGDGRMEDCWLARKMGFEAKAFESLPYRLFNHLYQQMDFLLMISYFEGGPANIPEAQATATPLLTRDIGMAHDVVRHGENGLIISGDPVEDAKLLNRLAYNDKGLTNTLYRGAFRHAAKTTTWEETVRRNYACYQELVSA